MGKALYSVGFWIRETGQALDRLGCRLQGKNHFREQRTISFHSNPCLIPSFLSSWCFIDWLIMPLLLISSLSMCVLFSDLSKKKKKSNQAVLIYFKKIAESDSLQLFVSVLCICLLWLIHFVQPSPHTTSYAMPTTPSLFFQYPGTARLWMFLTKPLVSISRLSLLPALLSLVMSMWDQLLPFGMDASWEVNYFYHLNQILFPW